RVALVGPRIRAKVERVLVDLGDVVREGTPLAGLSSVELGTAKAAYLTAAARLATRRATYEREERLFRDSISSEAELLEARALFREAEAELEASRETLRLYGLPRERIDAIEAGGEEPLSFFRLLSPVGGTVQRRDLSPGQTVEPDAAPVHVARLDRLWLMIDAFERDLPLLETGQPVRFTVRSLPGETFEAVTDWISYELDPETRTVRVRAVAENRGGLLRAGMFGTAAIQVEGQEARALVPVDAVQTLDGRRVLFVPAGEPGSFRPVSVRLGEEFDGTVEIVEGTAPGDSAVVAGAFELLSAATAEGREAEHH
ncbi:MAG: efflux RND transporter periplasmic adaptor subunit, partial [Gemmatimonadota bacterium]